MIQVLNGEACSVLQGMEENSVDTVYTAPSPFGYYPSSDDASKDRIGGEPSVMEYVINLVNICNECSRVLKPTGNLFIQLGDQYDRNGLLYGIPTLFEYKMHYEGWGLNDRLIWHRTEGRHKHKFEDKGFLKNYETIFHYVHRDFYFNQKSKFTKTSVFSYPLEDTYYTNAFDSGLPEELSKIIIDTTTKEGDTVLDPLAGSGKFGVVAKKMNRNVILIDIDPVICDLMRIRLGIV